MRRFGLLLLILLSSCSNELDILAPYKSYVVVYSVLNARDSIHYVRISKVFQTKGSSFEYAKKTDLSVKAQVFLLLGNDTILKFVPDTVTKEPGIFYDKYVAYKAKGKIQSGNKYKLLILTKDDKSGDSLIVTAETTVPSAPYVVTPDSVEFGAGNNIVYPIIPFEKDYTIEFYSYDTRIQTNRHPGSAYELRLYMDYKVMEPQDSSIIYEGTLRYGPILFTGKESLCNAELCFRLTQKSFIEFLKSKLTDDSKWYIYDDSKTSKALRLEITSLDEHMYKYLLVSSPAFEDFLEVRPKYTNVKLKRIKPDGTIEEEDGIGVLGSINTFTRYVRMSVCSQYLAGINNISTPPDNCE